MIGTILFRVQEDDNGVSVNICGDVVDRDLPEIIVRIEMVLLLNLLRKATKENIIPASVTAKQLFTNPEYEAFIGIKAEQGNENKITFSVSDTEIPFISRNDVTG